MEVKNQKKKPGAGFEGTTELANTYRKATPGQSKIKNGADMDTINENSVQRHIVNLTVSNPDHPMMSKRDEKYSKRVAVRAKDKGAAISGAIAHYKRKGYKVHDDHYVGLAEEVLDEGKHSFIGRIKRQKEADNKGWGKLGSAIANRRVDPDKAARDAKNANRYARVAGRVSEETEQLDELKTSTLASYVKKATKNMDQLDREAGQYMAAAGSAAHDGEHAVADGLKGQSLEKTKKALKRMDGIDTATAKYNKAKKTVSEGRMDLTGVDTSKHFAVGYKTPAKAVAAAKAAQAPIKANDDKVQKWRDDMKAKRAANKQVPLHPDTAAVQAAARAKQMGEETLTEANEMTRGLHKAVHAKCKEMGLKMWQRPYNDKTKSGRRVSYSFVDHSPIYPHVNKYAPTDKQRKDLLKHVNKHLSDNGIKAKASWEHSDSYNKLGAPYHKLHVRINEETIAENEQMPLFRVEQSEENEGTVNEGKWNYPDEIKGKEPIVYWDMGNSHKKAARKAHRKAIKAQRHKELMQGKQPVSESEELVHVPSYGRVRRDQALKGFNHHRQLVDRMVTKMRTTRDPNLRKYYKQKVADHADMAKNFGSAVDGAMKTESITPAYGNWAESPYYHHGRRPEVGDRVRQHQVIRVRTPNGEKKVGHIGKEYTVKSVHTADGVHWSHAVADDGSTAGLPHTHIMKVTGLQVRDEVKD